MKSFNTISDVQQYLDSVPMFQNQGRSAARFGLEGITALCEAIGNPQEKFRAIHVAGTNGKGSVCNLLHAVYRSAGHKTGMYTSPHLDRFNERFVINGREIPDDELLRFFQLHGVKVAEQHPTFFEISTAVAFWYFAEQKVDLAIIETGLGGRLDATNIITPLQSVITSIGLDHTDVLGETIPEIAAEKAGIIKNGIAVVAGFLPEEALEVIERVAASEKAPLIYASDLKPEWESGRITLEENGQKREYETGFHQPVQRLNVAMVRSVVDNLQQVLSVGDKDFAKGLLQASANGVYRARFEKISSTRDWYFDGAHNPEAFGYALELSLELAGNQKKILVFSVMRDKLSKDLLSMLSQFDELYYFESNLNRAALYQEVSALIPEAKRLNVEGWSDFNAKVTSESPFILFSGSLYFYSRIMNLLRNSA
ncbi:MAG: bifunctional folylpolyglutamate synthase/dihydrofolate synthase [Balneolia bacterium]|nr:bifunctional folylpolyglutamate synthase/dihydrofolate synthase [Balneolia bacterium]